MEELQDAIEDAQYMNAMHDDIPKPTKVKSFSCTFTSLQKFNIRPHISSFNIISLSLNKHWPLKHLRYPSTP